MRRELPQFNQKIFSIGFTALNIITVKSKTSRKIYTIWIKKWISLNLEHLILIGWFRFTSNEFINSFKAHTFYVILLDEIICELFLFDLILFSTLFLFTVNLNIILLQHHIICNTKIQATTRHIVSLKFFKNFMITILMMHFQF